MNYTFQQKYQGQPCQVTMTALLGHLMEHDFGKEYSHWNQVNIASLFEANIHKYVKEDMKSVADNLKTQGRQSQILVIWTDNDREGENIGILSLFLYLNLMRLIKGSEVVEIVKKANSNIIVKRARFSVIQDREIKQAWNHLQELDYFQVDAVDARSELDLRIGAAFTRFQTLQLKNKFHELQQVKVLSFGSCQFPTLGFIVDRFQKVQNFISQDFWSIEATLEKNGKLVQLNWNRARLFDQHIVFTLYEMCVENPLCTITSFIEKPTSKWAPLPLTTVELQKMASIYLKMSSDKTMTVAEKLYNQGIISYPRTETDVFDDKFELHPLISCQVQDSRWGPYAQGYLLLFIH